MDNFDAIIEEEDGAQLIGDNIESNSNKSLLIRDNIESSSNNPGMEMSKEMLKNKYCGGAKISSTKAAQDIVLPSYEGLRLYNPRNNCYIHAALNSIVTNPHIMEEMSYAFQLPGMPPLFREIENMIVCRDEILNVVGLKKQLYNTFPNTPSYNSDGQEDAAVPFWDIVNCLPVLEIKFMIKVKKVWKCLECQYEETKLEDLSYPDLRCCGSRQNLQDKINEWSNNIQQIDKRCICKLFINGKRVAKEDEPTVPNTPHTATRQLVSAPQLLYIKVRDRMFGEVAVNVTESITMGGLDYKLKSAMLYSGSGSRGHWRCLVKEGEGYVVYNDMQVSSLLDAARLKSEMRQGTDFIFIAENFIDRQVQSLPAMESDIPQSTSLIHDEATTTM